MAKSAVLDSSSVLAVLFEEPGGESVSDLLNGGLLSAVNLAEILTKLKQGGWDANFALGRVLNMGFEVCPYETGQARLTSELIDQTRPYGLSLGDRACLALAIQRKATVYTTDRAWKKLSLGIEVEVIR
ncbi:MAG: type II toxin-antitoxin system VapC family toxin [Terracidiphilus sp.]